MEKQELRERPLGDASAHRPTGPSRSGRATLGGATKELASEYLQMRPAMGAYLGRKLKRD